MPNQILRRRGDASAHSSFTGGTGEITYITDTKALAIHDSSTVGGFPIHKFVATKTTLTADGIIYASSTTALTNSSALTWDGTTLTVDGNLTFTGAQSITTSAGALTIQPASGSGVTITLATTGDLIVNTTHLVVDTSAAAVGIGTVAPAAKLDVDKGTLDDVFRLASSRNVAAGSLASYYFNRGAANVADEDKVSLVDAFSDSDTTASAVKTSIKHVTVDKTNASPKSAITFSTQNASTTLTEVVRISGSNLGIGTTSFGTSASIVLGIKTGTAPSTGPADTVQFYSSDNSGGHTIPSFFCEGTEVIATGQADSASSVRIKMRINGTIVTILCV